MPIKSNNGSTANRFARIGYNTIVKRNSIFLTTIFVSAFAAEMVFDSVSDRIWDNINKGRGKTYLLCGHRGKEFEEAVITGPDCYTLGIVGILKDPTRLHWIEWQEYV
ncbi:hypothetical protein BGW38_001703 [Lunasporangiospora selenospora]|uniref:Complex III subunit 9 n=1 Tax=Lunasporangiospora selenospora TaxID=979761 RepID=A0A9P6FT25_9FUNG|nr:hypothetical protein BGW38_001703 [Lunasporangiospora selenospora]